MESVEAKSVAALLQGLIILSGYEKDETVKLVHNRIFIDLCYMFKHLPCVRDIEEADLLEVFARISDERIRLPFIETLLRVASTKLEGEPEDGLAEKYHYLIMLLSALDR